MRFKKSTKKASRGRSRPPKASPSFKKALRKLINCPSHGKKCGLILNASDKFISDLAPHVKYTLPAVSPLLSTTAKQSLRKFSNVKLPMATRRKLLHQQGGGFLSLLAGLIPSIIHGIGSLFSSR